MNDSEKLEILANWLASSKEPQILTRLDHVLITEAGRETIINDLRRMAKVIKWMHEEESPISPGDTLHDYYLESLET